MRKLAFYRCKNKSADQLGNNLAAVQCLCFHYMDITILLLSKSEISSHYPSSVSAQLGLCKTGSEPPNTGFHEVAHFSRQCTSINNVLLRS